MPEENLPVPANQTKVFFGLVFDVDGKEVALEPSSAINEIKENGIECGLPPNTKVELGRAGDRINGILESFGVPEDSKLPVTDDEINNKFPDVAILKTSYKKMVDALLTIEEFHVKIPGSKAKEAAKSSGTTASSLYTIGLSATWPEVSTTEGEGSGIGNLALKGIYLTVSNEK